MLRDLIKRKGGAAPAKRPDLSRIKTGVNEGRDEALKAASKKPEVPDDCFRKCNFCKRAILNRDVRENLYRCPKCGGYFRVHAYRRVEMIADAGSFEERLKSLPMADPLGFPNYAKKLREMQEATGLDEAAVCGSCTIGGQRAVLCVMDARFIMSSMGHNVGEKLTEAIEYATETACGVVIYCCSGGARMQEGIISLMQMAKTAAALRRHHDAGLLSVTVLTNPTTGGVTASFAMLGDVILAEPGALIGFAGPRVIEQTIGQKLPEGFQRAEFLLKHGFLDGIAERAEQKTLLARLLRLHDRKRQKEAEKALLSDREAEAAKNRPDTQAELQEVPEADQNLPDAQAPSDGQPSKGTEPQKSRTAWERVQLSRGAERPRALDYIGALFQDFTELHGDRAFGDDGAVVGGIASFFGIPVTVIAEQKGSSTKENLHRRFGMPAPEGYRKALRLMREAEAFGRPVICFVDTPGAYPGIESEERGQGQAIAECLYTLSELRVPVLSVVLSEGGSGGALALAVSDEVWMLENAVYSILSPEGFASILYKDAGRAKEAAGVMKLTAEDLLKLSVIERVIPEKEPASAETLGTICGLLRPQIAAFLKEKLSMDADALLAARYARYRKF